MEIQNEIAGFMKILAEYDDQLEKMGIVATEFPENGVCMRMLGPMPLLQHARWMIGKMKEHMSDLASYDSAKMHRWLGFIQAILWSNEKQSIQNLKDQVIRNLIKPQAP